MRDKRARQAARTAHAEARMLKQPCCLGTSGAPVCLEHGREERISAAEAEGVRRQEQEGRCVLRGGCKLYPDGVQEPGKNFKQGIDMNRLVISKPWQQRLNNGGEKKEKGRILFGTCYNNSRIREGNKGQAKVGVIDFIVYTGE